MFSSFCFQRILRIQNPVYMYIYVFFFLFPSFCFQKILRIQNPVYMYIYVFFSLFPSFCFQRILRIQNPVYMYIYVFFYLFPSFCFQKILRIQNAVYMYIYVFFFLFPENTENTEQNTVYMYIYVFFFCFQRILRIQNPVYMYIYVFFFLFQRILRIQNPVYMYIYVFFFLFPENTENTEHSIHVHLCFLLSVSREYWEYRTQYTCTSMFSSVCFQRILRIQNPVYMYIYVFFFCFQRILRIQNPVYMYIYVFFCLFPENTENTEPSIHVHLCFLLSVSREYWEYRTQYTCTSMFSSFCFQRILRIQNPVYMYIYVFFFCFQRILRIQNPVYMYIYVFFFLFPENTENTEPSIHVHLCFLLSVSREYWEYRTQYTCTSMFSSFCFQKILRIQNPVYMYIYVFFFLFPENTENTEPSIHVHLCFLLSVSREYWEYRTQYTCTSMFSSFCFQRILRIQNPVYMYIYVFFYLFPENTENTEPSIHVHLCFLLSVSREYWEYRTQYTCTSMFSSFCFQRILRIQNPVYMYIYVFFFLFPENTENTEPSIHVHLCFLLSVSREYWEYRTQYTCTSMFSSFCFQRILRIQNPVYMYIYVFFYLFQRIPRIQNPVYMYIYVYFFLFLENTENTEPSIHVHLCFLLSVSREYWEYRTQYTCTSMFSSSVSRNTENTEPSIHVHLCFLLSVSREYWEYRTQYTCTSMFSSFCFQRILRIQNPVYMYIYVFFFLFPENTENTEPSIHVHLCFLLSVSENTENTEPSIHVHLCLLLSVSREYWEYRTQYTCTSMFSSFCFQRILRIQNPVYMYIYVFFFCFQRILRIQNPVYMYIYVFFFLFPENTENTEPSIHVHLCFLLSVSREYWEYRTQYTCTSMFSSFCFQRILRIQNPVYMYIYVFFFCFQRILRIQNPVYMYIYVFFFLFPENTENTEPSIHVHLCFLLSVSRKYWEYRTQYTCTSMFSSFCFQKILRIQNPVYMYIYVFFFLFPENTENTEPSIHVHLCFLLSVSREYWEYRTQYTCTSMFSSFCFQRILRIQNAVYMYIYVFFFLFPENTENTEPSIHVHLCFLLSVSRILRIQNTVYMYIYVFFCLFPENTENTEPSIHVHLCFLLSVSENTENTEPSIHVHLCFLLSVSSNTENTEPVYMYIYVFFFLFPENTENTEPSIHVHLCFLLSVSREYWEYRTQYTCTSMFSSVCFQ